MAAGWQRSDGQSGTFPAAGEEQWNGALLPRKDNSTKLLKQWFQMAGLRLQTPARGLSWLQALFPWTENAGSIPFHPKPETNSIVKQQRPPKHLSPPTQCCELCQISLLKYSVHP